MDDTAGGPEFDELLDDQAAAEVLEVAPDRIQVMVDEGMISPVGESPRTFRRSELYALRESGG